MSVAVSVVIPAYNEGEDDRPGPRPASSTPSSPTCEVLVVVDFAEDTTVPVRRGVRRARSRGCAPLVNTYGRGPANAIRYGIDHVTHAGRGRDDGRRQRRPAPDRRRWRGSSTAASSSPPPRATRPAASRSAARCSRACCRATAGRSLGMLARVGTRDATNSFKAYSTDFVREVGHRQPQRLRDRPRADRQGPPAAAAGRRDPDHLARPHRRRVQLRPQGLDPEVPALVPLRVRPAAHPRAR